MRTKTWFALILAGMLLFTVSCGSGSSENSTATQQGYPTKYAQQRERIFGTDLSDANKTSLSISKGKLVETISGKAAFAYYGEMKNSRPDGFGIIVDHHNIVFGGEFKKGEPCGYGIVFYADDYNKHPKVYEGDDCSFVSIGGLQRFQVSGNGFVYENFGFDIGEPHILYQGQLEKNERDGSGCEYYNDGSIIGFGPLQYDGEFKNDEFSGDGVLYSEDGTVVYEGEFKKDTFHGDGTLYNEDGSVKYEGKFKNGDIKG